jgi:hypothetical protein
MSSPARNLAFTSSGSRVGANPVYVRVHISGDRTMIVRVSEPDGTMCG